MAQVSSVAPQSVQTSLPQDTPPKADAKPGGNTAGNVTSSPSTLSFTGTSLSNALLARGGNIPVIGNPVSTTQTPVSLLNTSPQTQPDQVTGNNNFSPPLYPATTLSPEIILAGKPGGGGNTQVNSGNQQRSSGATGAKPIEQRMQLGADTSGTLRQATANQLQLEANINRPSDSNYAAGQERLANNMRNGSAPLPQGSYRPITPTYPRPVPNTGATNPLAIRTFSVKDPATNKQVTSGPVFEQAVQRQLGSYQAQITSTENQLRIARAATAISPGVGGVSVGMLETRLSQLKFQQGAFINNVRLQSGNNENGKMYLAVGAKANSTQKPAISVGGINTDLARQQMQGTELSNTTGLPVQQIINVSSKDDLITRSLQLATQQRDPAKLEQQILQDHASNKPTSIAAANAILAQMNDGSKDPIRLVGYSQGVVILQDALRQVDTHLTQQVQAGKLNQTQKVQMLQRVQLLTFGAAADKRNLTQELVNGQLVPRSDLSNVHVLNIREYDDPISNAANVGKDKPDLRSSGVAGAVLLGPNGVLPHLDYYNSYVLTDKGASYDPRVTNYVNQWRNQQLIDGDIALDSRPQSVRGK